jgi:tyrosyl-tRNA synthetase
MFGKVMSIPDNMIVRYYRYGARASEKDIKEMEEQLKSDSFNPRDAKVRTAKAIVAIYHGVEAGENALAEFEKIFKNKDVPDEIEEMKLDLPTPVQPLMDVLVLTNLAPSKKEAKRLIEQGGVMIDGEKVSDFRAEIDLSSERLLKVGKRKFLRIK